jgi:hypothetical protein
MEMQRHEWMGKTGKDTLQGFVGVVTGYCQDLIDEDQLLLTPKCTKEHKRPTGCWFNVKRIELVEGDA